nr:glutamine-hydrolyzing GMP synthase [Ignavibacteriaceae bacterium]
MKQRDLILIIDFGSQYTQLIARRVREVKVYSEIHPHTISLEAVKELNPRGIILSGGPMSVYDESAPDIDPQIFNLKVPFLGLCYGLQLICKNFGGVVEPATNREYGKSILRITDNTDILHGVEDASVVWMSHGDYLTELPKGFKVVGESDHSPICAISNPSKRFYGLQFHPEVVHTEEGEKILNNFLFDICKCTGDWTPQNFIDEKLEIIKSTI